MTQRWALILGVSSGFGAATARVLARKGLGILGVHLDRRSTQPAATALAAELAAFDVPVHFFNENAADEATRGARVANLAELLGDGEQVDVFLHSLAFGTLKPLVPTPGQRTGGVSQRQLDMTTHVMAHTLVYWVQDLLAQGLLGHGSRLYAMSSSGSQVAWPEYGPVGAAKAALEAHVRQLSFELTPYGATINGIMAGVARTPALLKIPSHQKLIARALAKNPHSRLTTPEDVAACIGALAVPETHWMTGNIIRVDGGEDFCD